MKNISYTTETAATIAEIRMMIATMSDVELIENFAAIEAKIQQIRKGF